MNLVVPPSGQSHCLSPRAHKGTRSSGSKITEREREIAAFVAQGRSNSEIAQTLQVEVKTVEAHLTRIFAKLGASSRVQIATWAVERSLIPSQWPDEL